MNVQTKPKSFLSGVVVGAILLLALRVETAQAAAPIVLDGNLSDWTGHAQIDDPAGDAENDKTDITNFYFATNPNDETAYFMAERLAGGPTEITYYLYLDTDNDEDFSEATERLLMIDYNPLNGSSSVDVRLFSGDGTFLQTLASDMAWGESQEQGGNLAEWGVSFAALGIAPYQVIQMQLESRQGNHASDSTAIVQWSPASLLGPALLVFILVAASVWMAYRRRKMA